MSSYCGNELITFNRLVRVKLSAKKPATIVKSFNIQFPKLIKIEDFKLVATKGEKATFALEGNKIVVTLELPDSVLIGGYTGKVIIQAKDVRSAALVYLI